LHQLRFLTEIGYCKEVVLQK